MKMFGTFLTGAVAGFLFGSTKQGLQVRKDIDELVKGLVSGDIKLEDLKNAANSKEPLEADGRADKAFDFAADQPIDHSPLGLDKATELAEKLGAKVSEPQGEEALPHSHHIDIPTNKLSA